jgi:hypothetical protein
MKINNSLVDFTKMVHYTVNTVHLCDVVITVPGYRSRSPGSIPGAARFSEK